METTAATATTPTAQQHGNPTPTVPPTAQQQAAIIARLQAELSSLREVQQSQPAVPAQSTEDPTAEPTRTEGDTSDVGNTQARTESVETDEEDL